MVADNNLQERSGALRQAAAEELATRLKGLADALAESGARPKRFWYGNGRIKRRSPSGFLLDTFGPHLLLPDGRLWHHHSRRNPEGILFRCPGRPHPRCAWPRFRWAPSVSRLPLGAVVHKYSFGYLDHDDEREDGRGASGAAAGTLCAISGKANSPQYVDADAAFTDIARTFRPSRRHAPRTPDTGLPVRAPRPRTGAGPGSVAAQPYRAVPEIRRIVTRRATLIADIPSQGIPTNRSRGMG